MSVFNHTHLCGDLDDVRVGARQDDGIVYVDLHVGDHSICLSGNRDEVARLIQRMQAAVAHLPQDGAR